MTGPEDEVEGQPHQPGHGIEEERRREHERDRSDADGGPWHRRPGQEDRAANGHHGEHLTEHDVEHHAADPVIVLLAAFERQAALRTSFAKVEPGSEQVTRAAPRAADERRAPQHDEGILLAASLPRRTLHA